jgi:sensor histidine kinase regulating citrate/malate metabolism
MHPFVSGPRQRCGCRISEHHGSVEIEDNQPHGTVFSLELPQA